MAILNGYYPPNNWQLCRIGGEETRIRNAPARLVERSSMSVDELESKIAAFKQKDGIRLVFVDQLDKLKVDGWGKMSDYDRKTAVSIALQEASRRLELPIVTLTQINREGAKVDRPRLTDLKGSGQIEQDADVVLLLNKEESDENERTSTIQLEIAKNRNGPRGGIINFRNTADRFRFEESQKDSDKQKVADVQIPDVQDWTPPSLVEESADFQ